MPIYAYRCETCGFTKDVLQKLSDAPLTECPSCAKSTFRKQLTAAGFQLKGTGWYATDFKNNGSSTSPSSGKTAAAEPACPAAESCGGGCAADTSAAA
ncbi:MAG TPA: FmdB family zinc ribbon protein [Noviherbaspirillum sp.]|uniref:FmdB family zinc ribbon protein n=1 Tax=Noviherbaspirillum sp. TaxID=1926288 RepID=UPI002B48D57E|nr:FmdB family zinc ribbon protein [Noviherbaspirillum sp.]HJV87994.1 FmdB family zinc ribbon protein [Noviherbaspirillum sp.]